MPFVLKETGGEQRYYGGDVKGWIPNPPPEPPPPVDEAQRFPDKDTAAKFAEQHGMKAAPEEVQQ